MIKAIHLARMGRYSPMTFSSFQSWLLENTKISARMKKSLPYITAQSELKWLPVRQRARNVYRRFCRAMPLQLIEGTVEFMGHKVHCKTGVLIPRWETEEWVSQLISSLSPRDGNLAVLDLCTGSGCIAIAMAKACEKFNVVAVDLDGNCVELAQRNAIENNCSILVKQMDVRDSLLYFKEASFDVITCNPPYIPESSFNRMDRGVKWWESKASLISGSDGLDLVKHVISIASKLLKKSGVLVFEFDGAHQVESIKKHSAALFNSIQFHRDSAGKYRWCRMEK